MIINNLDDRIQTIEPNPLLCLLRTNTAVQMFGAVKKVGTLLVFDTTIKDFDCVWSFHSWCTMDGQLWDSHKSIIEAMEAHKAQGMDFGTTSDPKQWKVAQIKYKGGNFPPLKNITKKLKDYKKRGVDAIYLENYLNIEDTKGINESMQSIVDTQLATHTNKSFLEGLKANNEML